MEIIQYRIIKSKKQYNQYCSQLQEIIFANAKSKTLQDDIELLTLLIEKWDATNNSFSNLDPIQLLHSLMTEKQIKPKDLVEILGVSKGYLSKILNYKKGLSKEVIRNLASYFKVSQEAFNREYKLRVVTNLQFKNASLMNTRKDFAVA